MCLPRAVTPVEAPGGERSGPIATPSEPPAKLTMTRTLACITAFIALTGSAGGATPSPVQAAFGNTLVSTYPDGRKAALWLRPEGDYTIRGRRGDISGGHWRLKDDKVCLRQARPFPVPFSFCSPIPSNPAGGSWLAKAFTGETIRMELVKGDGQSGHAG